MKKEDLKYGNVLETELGYKYLIFNENRNNNLYNLDGSDIKFLSHYDTNLKYLARNYGADIVKVYKDYTCQEVLWERKEKPKIVLTNDEKAILRSLPKEYKYIARDKNGNLWIYSHSVKKDTNAWYMFEEYIVTDCIGFTLFNKLFQFIKWEDEEPYSIEELLNDR